MLNINDIEAIVRDFISFMREDKEGETRLNYYINKTKQNDNSDPVNIPDDEKRYRKSNVLPEAITDDRWVNVDFEQTDNITNNFVLKAINYAMRVSIVDKSQADNNTFYRLSRYNKALNMLLEEYIDSRSNTRGVQSIDVLAADIIERVEFLDSKIKALQSSITFGITIL